MTKLEKERQKVKSHMEKWNDFKNQSTLVKCESLIARIDQIPREHEERFAGMWNSAYWEECTSNKGEKGILIKAFNANVRSNLFTQSFAMKIQNELNLISKGILNGSRVNDFLKNDYRYNTGYSIFIKLDDLIKCPLDYLLACNEHIIAAFKNIPLTKIILTDQSFFQTKSTADWRIFLIEQGLYKNDLNSSVIVFQI